MKTPWTQENNHETNILHYIQGNYNIISTLSQIRDTNFQMRSLVFKYYSFCKCNIKE